MQVRVLGGVELVAGEEVVSLHATMPRRLLAALAIGAGRRCSTDTLIEAVWPERPPPSARKLLQVYISQLRKLLPEGAQISTHDSAYALELPVDALDSVLFERLLGEARAAGDPALAVPLLARALELWRGDAFEEFRYEDFARGESDRLEELRLLAREELFAAELELGRHEHVLADLLAAARANGTRETLQALAVLALYRAGRQSEALELYTETRERLLDELGLEPGPELRDLQQRILRHDPTLAEDRVPSRSRLPAGPNRLIGRERELAELQALLERDDVRLLVLSGAGGTGKTRLAIEAARAAESRFSNGAAFVALAPLRDPALVGPTIAGALGVQEMPGRDPVETIGEALDARELLLVLDNAEHLRDAAPLYVELLARIPGLKLLITSRAVLHLSGEHVYPVEPLAEDDAAMLFRERAQQAEPRVDLDEEAIRHIVTRLDGLPLALELAAGRVRTLSTAQLLERLDRRLPLLTAGPRDLPARQQTLHATIDWSHELLDPEAQRLLARLSVFAGGWTLESAAEVAGAELDAVQRLVDGSLVVRERGRFSMLETIREYAAARLADSDEAAALARRHAEHVLALAEQAENQLEGAQQAEWLERLEAELADVRAALDWSHAPDASELNIRLAGALRTFWFKRGRLSEGRRRLAEALALHTVADAWRIKAFFGAALLATLQGDWSQARRLSLACSELCAELGEPQFAAISLVTLGRAALGEGDQEQAGAAFDEAIRLADENDDHTTLGMARFNRGYLALDTGDLARADVELSEAHDEFTRRGDPSGVARSLAARGSVAIRQGRTDDAIDLLRASLGAARMDRESVAWPLQLLGIARSAEPAAAATLLGAAEALREAIDVPLGGIELAQHEQAVETIRSQLSDDEFVTAWTAGRELSVEEALQAAGS